MRFLIDNALSPIIARALRDTGHDAIHVRDIHMEAENDRIVLARAGEEERILISADTDFATLLAKWHQPKPSVILFRGGMDRRPERQVDLLLANLPAIRKPLEEGAIVVFDKSRIRVRSLPIVH